MQKICNQTNKQTQTQSIIIIRIFDFENNHFFMIHSTLIQILRNNHQIFFDVLKFEKSYFVIRKSHSFVICLNDCSK